MNLKEKLKNWWHFERIFQIIGFLLFCTYLSMLYINYDIDNKQVFEPIMTYFMFFLRWTTITIVGYSVITPFFKGKTFKAILCFLGPVVGLLNLILFNQNMIAWGASAVAWRKVMFVLEQIFILIISIYYLILMIKNKEYKEINFKRLPIIFVLMYATFAYQPMFFILFGEYGEKTTNFSFIHIVFILLNFIFLIVAYVLMRKKTLEEKKLFFAALACSGVFNFFYIKYGGLASLPLHLCNAAIVMMFVAYIFNAKGVFYFTYFVNVIGALFAMLMPNVESDAFTHGSLRFWYNHIYAFVLPILGVALHVYERPKLKMIAKAIMWFTVYFVLVIIFNAIFSNYTEVDYFFINSNFYFEKLHMKTSLKDNYTWIIMLKDDFTLIFYPLFYFVVYVIYIGLMFVMWFIYDSLYNVSDSHYKLKLKKKINKQKELEMIELMKDKDKDEPLYGEAINMIEIKDFTKIYSGSDKPSVDNLTLTVPNGCVYGFLGHNGAGKSTTIKALVGIHSITKGHIIVEGYDVEKQPVQAKLNIGYVSDNHAVYERLTGREYINYIADLYMVSKEDREERIKKYAEMFNLTDAIDKEIKSYSHGMKQKIVVIASLIHDPKVWILDEPLTGLDPMSSHQIKECMRDHANRGNIVFFSSHVIEVVEKICDRICIINHGHLCCEYDLKELKEKNIQLEDLYLKYFGNEGVKDAS